MKHNLTMVQSEPHLAGQFLPQKQRLLHLACHTTFRDLTQRVSKTKHSTHKANQSQQPNTTWLSAAAIAVKWTATVYPNRRRDNPHPLVRSTTPSAHASKLTSSLEKGDDKMVYTDPAYLNPETRPHELKRFMNPPTYPEIRVILAYGAQSETLSTRFACDFQFHHINAPVALQELPLPEKSTPSDRIEPLNPHTLGAYLSESPTILPYASRITPLLQRLLDHAVFNLGKRNLIISGLTLDASILAGFFRELARPNAIFLFHGEKGLEGFQKGIAMRWEYEGWGNQIVAVKVKENWGETYDALLGAIGEKVKGGSRAEGAEGAKKPAPEIRCKGEEDVDMDG